MGLLDSLFDAFAPESLRSSGGSFRSRLDRISRETGIPSRMTETGKSGFFLVPFNGDNYLLMFMPVQDKVEAHCLSNVKFRPGRLPQAVNRFLADRNRKLEFGDWDTLNADDESCYVFKGKVALHHFDTAHMKAIVVNYVPEVAALDATLRDEGLAL